MKYIGKLLGVFLISAALVVSAAGCSGGSQQAQTETEQQGAENQTGSSEKSEKKSSKNQYKNINADTSPIGVSDTGFVIKGNTVRFKGNIHKNAGDDSDVKITFEVFDGEGKYLGQEVVTSSRILAEGDVDVFDTYTDELENRTEEEINSWKASVIEIEETSQEDKEAEQELNALKNQIDYAIYAKEYNKAEILLDEALEKYPDNKDIKLLQAELDDARGETKESESPSAK